ncbi:hypothetical protein [Vibrio parahaemolyticus]|uniref:hypothetical protein n=1 Tax=Vibrio parahaemolyticus TaxID=670 RepID=UPI0031FEE12B
MTISYKEEIAKIRNELVPNVVSYVEIEWGSFISFKTYASEIPALVDWCKANISLTTGYEVTPIKVGGKSPRLRLRSDVLEEHMKSVTTEPMAPDYGRAFQIMKRDSACEGLQFYVDKYRDSACDYLTLSNLKKDMTSIARACYSRGATYFFERECLEWLDNKLKELDKCLHSDSKTLRHQVLSDDFSGIKKEVVELSKGQEVLLAKAAIDAAQKESGFVVGSEINEEALELFSSILEKKLIAQEIAIKQGVESTIKDMKQQIEHFKKHGDQWEAELIEGYCETLEELISKKS